MEPEQLKKFMAADLRELLGVDGMSLAQQSAIGDWGMRMFSLVVLCHFQRV